MTVAEWLDSAQKRLAGAGIKTARLDALVLMESYSGHDRSWLLANPNHILNSDFLKKVIQALERREKREPLAYILGQKEFYGLEFQVTPDVLIPRPETETLVEYCAETAPAKAEVLELGTGSGCIAVSLKTVRPDLDITATDISPAALEVARKNAKKHGTTIRFLLSDLFSSSKLKANKFQLIIANLPYVPEGTRIDPELEYEPAQALYAGPDGLDYYCRFMLDAPRFLSADGKLVIEAGPTQHKQLKQLGKSAGYNLKSISEYILVLKPSA